MAIFIGDKNALRNILLYHITRGIYIGSGFEPGVTNILKTIQGSKLFLKTVSTKKKLMILPLIGIGISGPYIK